MLIFWELVIKGDKLIKYHLMKETRTEISTYPIPGQNEYPWSIIITKGDKQKLTKHLNKSLLKP